MRSHLSLNNGQPLSCMRPSQQPKNLVTKNEFPLYYIHKKTEERETLSFSQKSPKITKNKSSIKIKSVSCWRCGSTRSPPPARPHLSLNNGRPLAFLFHFRSTKIKLNLFGAFFAIFVIFFLLVACAIFWFACLNQSKKSPCHMVDCEFYGGGSNFGPSCLSLCNFFIVLIVSFNKVSNPIVWGYECFGLHNNNGIKNRMDCMWFSLYWRIYKSQALCNYSVGKGSPRYIFLAFFCNPPRSCNVSVSCRWTISEAQKKQKFESCHCGIKRTTWNHSLGKNRRDTRYLAAGSSMKLISFKKEEK